MITQQVPTVFISYSHDDQEHKDWILTLSTRLLANGVNVILDHWDLNLGSDLPRFMESGLTEADRVLAVCTGQYVAKANLGQGGVGYEKMILTAQLMRDITAEKIIPVIRRNELEIVLPTFLGARLYIDFRDPTQYEAKYAELIREIHGAKIQPRPPLGKNPFSEREEFRTPSLSTRSERYVSPPLRGVVTFDFSNNNGCYVIGSGDMVFETMWSGGSNSAIHVYSDSSSIHNLALAIGAKEITDIDDASAFDTSSRVRMPQLGEIVVWQNIAGYYAAVRIEALNCRSHGRDKDEVTFSYAIQHDRTPSFKMMLL